MPRQKKKKKKKNSFYPQISFKKGFFNKIPIFNLIYKKKVKKDFRGAFNFCFATEINL